MTRQDAIKHDRVRHLILKALAPDYPDPIDTVVLRRLLSTMGYPMSESDLKSYVAYLEEKGLIKVDKRANDIVLIRATATGLDAMDARIEVKGVGQNF